MKLSRTTALQNFDIKEPIWRNGRMVGLATYKIGTHNKINILKTNKDGERIFPQPFYISGARARQFPIEPVRSNPNIKLHIVPINDLEILEVE